MLVVYEGDGEILICDKENENRLIREYFSEGGRSIGAYDRTETDKTVEVQTRMVASTR